ncbi:thioester reductase domain-containing protein [Listeria ivanovii]|uniref:thioester reductase domain-containing protein n=1 Tax=Listeria ivanovii TaxID=1638 RepID=UPI0019404368|nr:thioester reductase domain-containing protein [Listeria ivanovii]MBM5607256.1 NAD-dependent epimerase/dehydratase family protein [Listeria ivanovii]MBM5635694.1 NAD-dependent epimerase/dehydratase family protein [Listeria ivanovii]MBM5706015.1 NAD-dependent epimerase/dehydratase family protein [Listeria ivanovii]
MKLFENELNVKEINREDDFFEIGGNSMKILPIYAGLKTTFPTARIQDFYDFRSVKNLAEHYDKQQVSVLDTKEHLPISGANEIDGIRTNHQEIDDELNKIKKESVGFNHVLFTGATGFLGANLLCELIKNSTAKFYCIVRSIKEMQPFDRLKQTIEYYVGKDNAKRYLDNIEIVSGDFTTSFLGLEKEEYERLAAKIDCIIHCAADVRHYGEPAEFINTNIEGTRVLLELASYSPKIHFHYMSTASIASIGKNYNEKPVFYESDFDFGQVLENQYLNSKFEAEKLVRTYKSKGVQTTIYRIGNLVGNSQDGKFQSNIDTNAFYRTVKAIILLHAAPIGGNSIDLTTIDYCSKTLTQIILQQNKLEDTYHIRNLNAISWDDCVSAIQNLGYPILKMSERKFQEFVLSMENFEKRKEAISLIIADYQESSKEENQEITIDCQRTREFNKINGIICPKPNDKLISILLRYMVDVQFIPKPFNWEWIDNS